MKENTTRFGRRGNSGYACAFIGINGGVLLQSACTQANPSVNSFLGSHCRHRVFQPARFLACANRAPNLIGEREHASRHVHLSTSIQSWRNPRWLLLRNTRNVSEMNGALETCDPVTPIAFAASMERLPFKLFWSLMVAVTLSFLGFSYARFQTIALNTLTDTVESVLKRPFHVSRIARCNPITGIRLVNVQLPPSMSNPTAPALSAAYIDIMPSGTIASILSRRPLRIDVRLHHATIKVSQRVVAGPNGMPIGEWDPGVQEGIPDQKNTSLSELSKILRIIQPGTLSVRKALVALQPADFQDYGHGDEVVNVKNVSADVTFPKISVSDALNTPVDLRGLFQANVRGTPVDGGSISMRCSLSGDSLFDLQKEDVAANLHVTGHGVRACRVASFLNLPFRADDGCCSGDIDMDFLYDSESLVPIMRGEATLDSVALRFHPDPKTPQFHGINGKLRFEGKTVFLEGPVGDFGSLPMTVVGNIHLEDGYDLMGYCHSIDVNNIIDTFQVDNFVPLEGTVKGEARMTGILEEPMVSGWVESVGERAVIDKVPMNSAHLTFDWDAIAGILRFPDITGLVEGGGSVSGAGSMYFDMTKESPFDIRQERHSKRSPKAEYWNKEETPKKDLPPPPSDAMEVDEFAPYREYDSLRFDFKVADVKGGDLLRFYGDEYGAMASNSIGLVSGEGVLAGHVNDATCRVLWRSVSPPPAVHIHKFVGDSVEAERSAQKDGQSPGKFVDPNERLAASSIPTNSSVPPRSKSVNGDDVNLGGGFFNGLVHIKLGDPPEARRVKIRTIVKDFDGRRAAWGDDEFRKFLKHSPLLQFSTDTFFKGVLYQRPVIPAGMKKMSRTLPMELLGVDGALVVKSLSLNGFSFDKVLTGSFSFSTSDFEMSLKEVQVKRALESHKLEAALLNEKTMKEGESGDEDQGKATLDEISFSASLKGGKNFLFRCGDAEIAASFAKDDQNQQIASLTTSNVLLEYFLGHHDAFQDAEALGGAVNVSMNLNLTAREGEGSMYINDFGVGPLRLSSVSGSVFWRGRDIFLQEGRVNYHKSEYHIDARYSTQSTEFEWDVNVGIPRANIRDVAELIRNGNAVATALQAPTNQDMGVSLTSNGPTWLRRLLESCDDDRSETEVWEVPQNLSFSEQVDWVCAHAEEQKALEKSELVEKRELQQVDNNDDFRFVGDIAGRITMSYNSRNSDSRQGIATSGNALLQSFLNQLSRTTFSFLLVGKDWRFGNVPLKTVSANGKYEEGVLSLGPFMFEGNEGFGAEASARISREGSLDGSVVVRNAPAALLQKYSRAPVKVSGEWSGRLEVGGNTSNPRALGRMVWTDATLNGKHVRDARTDMACVNGRCVLNVDAKIGSRRRSREQSDKQRVESLNWKKNVIGDLRDLASKASSKKMLTTTASKKWKDGNGRSETEDGLQVQISAPVRFYLLNYLRRSAPSSLWKEAEPVLGASFPSDDEWIVVNADVKKYGLILLNSIVPEVGWEGGNSDVTLRVSGSLKDPIVSGHISVSDGRLAPSVLKEPLQSVRGELVIIENGLVSLKSVSGRCAGKPVTVTGDMFISKEHVRRIQKAVVDDESEIKRMESTGNVQRSKRRRLASKVNDAKLMLQRGRKGIVAEFGEVPINFQKTMVSKLSGHVIATGELNGISIGGWITFSDGVIFVGNANSASSSVSTSQASIARSENGRIYTRSRSEPQGGTIERTDGSKDRKEFRPVLDSGRESAIRTSTSSDSRDSNTGMVRLDEFKISLGRGMKLVQPFVLDIEAAGSLSMNGASGSPDVRGIIDLVEGKVNALALQMRIGKNERSFVRFIGREEWRRNGNAGEPELMMQIVMENDDLIVRIGECKMSTWTENVKVVDKARQVEVEEIWGEEFQNKVEELGTGGIMKRFVVNSLMKMAEIGGKFGFLTWKVFPSLVSGEKSGNEVIKVREEIGVGGRIEIGGVSAAVKKSNRGDVEGKVQLQLGKFAKVRVGNDGPKLSIEVDLMPRLNIPGDDGSASPKHAASEGKKIPVQGTPQ